MLQKIELTGQRVAVHLQLRRYVIRKLASLDRYIPRHARESAALTVRLREVAHTGRAEYECEASLRMPHHTYTIAERGHSVHAAVDRASANLRQQIHKYKDTFTNDKRRRHLMARFGRQATSIPGLIGLK
jgi:ribosomal subunit interface protein